MSEIAQKAKPGHFMGNGADMLWRVEGDGIANLKDADKAKLVEGARIEASGENSADKTCKPSCRLNSDSIRIR